MNNQLFHSLLHIYVYCSLIYQLMTYFKNLVLCSNPYTTTYLPYISSLCLQWVCNWKYNKYTNRYIIMQKIGALEKSFVCLAVGGSRLCGEGAIWS